MILTNFQVLKMNLTSVLLHCVRLLRKQVLVVMNIALKRRRSYVGAFSGGDANRVKYV